MLWILVAAATVLAVRALIRADAAVREAESDRDDAEKALKTERTYIDAARDLSDDPAAARERLRRFGVSDPDQR